jgi:UrcA family protein
MKPAAARALGATVLAVAASAALARGAQAQDLAERNGAGRDDGGIVVEAPRALPPPPVRSPYSGAPVVTMTVRISARYADLDLTRPADAARLMSRISFVARDACRYLDRLFPLSPDPDCTDRAVAGATPAARAVIAASTKR